MNIYKISQDVNKEGDRMKYTKAFEKYWKAAQKTKFSNLEELTWEFWDEIKQVAFLSWKAGVQKTKNDYDLVKHKDTNPDKFLPF